MVDARVHLLGSPLDRVRRLTACCNRPSVNTRRLKKDVDSKNIVSVTDVGMSLEYEVGISPLNNSTVDFTFTETDNKKIETPDFHHLVISGE